jgi:molybdate transport system substrate-binding protein
MKRSGTATSLVRQLLLSPCITLLLCLTLPQPAAHADDVHAAVAANLTGAIKVLAPLFEQESGHRLIASFGASGKLYAQIRNGAPFDLLLSADTAIPHRLIEEGLAIPSSYFVYARGRLALWSPAPGYVDAAGAVLAGGDFSRIAIANPKTAPYGRAAMEVMTGRNLVARLQPKLITGENIAQTHQFIASGNVPLGFIALAQVLALPEGARGSYWIVPADEHSPIDQGAVILGSTKRRAAAETFLEFLKSPAAVAVIEGLGYETP